MTKEESLVKTSKDLLLQEPFYGIFLIMLDKQWNKQVPTAGVGKNGIGYRLYINEEFWKSLSNEHRRGLLKHELMHIAFSHLTEFEWMTNKEISNIAMDLEINQLIDPQYLPEGGQVLSLYPELNLEPKKGSSYYYEELMKAHKNKTCLALEAQLGSNGIRITNHDTWKEFDELSDVEKKLIQKQVEHILTEIADQVSKSRGNIPGEFSDIIKRITTPEPPKFDWKGYLRKFVGGSNKTFIKKSRRKPSKRFDGSPGLRIKHKRRILVGIDTSGSVSKGELKEFYAELYHMTKTGTEVRVAQFDAAISNISDFNYKDEIKIHGRGGTNFTSICDYYNEHKRDFAALIVATDGCAPPPENLPQGRVLWVHSNRSEINENLPGPKIKLIE